MPRFKLGTKVKTTGMFKGQVGIVVGHHFDSRDISLVYIKGSHGHDGISSCEDSELVEKYCKNKECWFYLDKHLERVDLNEVSIYEKI